MIFHRLSRRGTGAKVLDYLLKCLCISLIISNFSYALQNPSDNLFIKDQKRLLWFDTNGKMNGCGKTAIKFLKNDLANAIVEKNIDQIVKKVIKGEEDLFKKDAYLTDKILSRIKATLTGQLSPTLLGPNRAKLDPQSLNPQDVLDYIFISDRRCKLLNHLGIPNPQYQRLRNLLSEYQELKEELSRLDQDDLPFRKEDIHEFISTLRKLLWYYGESDDQKTNSKNFDQKLDASIRSLQKYLNLVPDGVIGEDTYKKIMTSVQHRINQIIVNMERWRWYPLHLEDVYALVNIPSYELHTFEKGKITDSMRVVVGLETRPTPLLRAPMSKVILNPTWVLPPVIINDKLQQTGGSLSALKAMNYKITDLSGNELSNPEFYDLNQVRITVPAGPYNGLGGYMFYIKNDLAIYPHGTNQPDKFKAFKRTFSSGCIRIEDPNRFAVWALKNNDKRKWNAEELRKKVEQKSTLSIDLEQSIPFYVSYATVWVDDHGSSVFFNDPYGIDALMIDKMGLKERYNGGSDGT